jgi:uncharacterized membrane protein YfcA
MGDMMVPVLLSLLALVGVVFSIALVRLAVARGQFSVFPEGVLMGAVTNFFDTLGIGSFAPTTAWIKLRKLTPDGNIPAVLNIGHCLPTVAEGLIFITLVKVDPVLLAACIVAAAIGATVGAPIVLRLPVRSIQLVVGIALLAAALSFVLKELDMLPPGGEALALPPVKFAIAVGANFLFGALMTAGIGLFAPSLATFSLLGLSPIAVFPIMMGAAGFLMPASGIGFLRSSRIDFKLALSMTLGGVPAVLFAAYVVKSLPLDILRWVVVVVILYTAAVMLRAALGHAKTVPE